jgi:ABC-2 type transport system ATP-binding protein
VKTEAIVAEGLTKRFGNFVAVDDVDLQVHEGEVFGYLGPNGAGKTTTIRMLTTLAPPTEGRASVAGYDVVRDPLRAKQHFGVVPEVSNVYDELTLWSNLMFSGEIYGMSKSDRKRKAEELLSLLTIAEHREKKARHLSKGLKRKLVLAMALINSPQILFLDEPSSGLDVESTRMLRDVVRELARGGMTIFLTTHNIEEANVLCDRVAIIVRGRIAATDSPENLKMTIDASRSVEVAFKGDTPHLEEWLLNSPSITSLRKEGDKWKIFTSDPPQLLDALVSHAQKERLHLVSINTLGPSLEDVFVSLVKGSGGSSK